MTIEEKTIELVTADLAKRIAKGDAGAKAELAAMVKQSLRPATCNCWWHGWSWHRPWGSYTALGAYNGDPSSRWMSTSLGEPTQRIMSVDHNSTLDLSMPGYSVRGDSAGNLSVARADGALIASN